MHLLVGLGNPGPKHAGNRHNIGFMAVDAIHRGHGLAPWRRRFLGETAEGQIDGHKVMLLKPMTYMNDSGRSVGEAMRFYGLEGDKLYVFHDELDLAPAKLRVKAGGGAAGNNGLRSVIQHLGPHFMRVRMGIGHPGDKHRVMPHVLSDFGKDERVWVEPMLDTIADAVGLLLKGEDGSFQNKVHLALNPPAEKPGKGSLAAKP